MTPDKVLAARVLAGNVPSPDSLGRYRVRDAAALLGVHENTIRNWVDDGFLVAERTPGVGFRRIPKSEIERLLAL